MSSLTMAIEKSACVASFPVHAPSSPCGKNKPKGPYPRWTVTRGPVLHCLTFRDMKLGFRSTQDSGGHESEDTNRSEVEELIRVFKCNMCFWNVTNFFFLFFS